jgi:hypothetical protein
LAEDEGAPENQQEGLEDLGESGRQYQAVIPPIGPSKQLSNRLIRETSNLIPIFNIARRGTTHGRASTLNRSYGMFPFRK